MKTLLMFLVLILWIGSLVFIGYIIGYSIASSEAASSVNYCVELTQGRMPEVCK